MTYAMQGMGAYYTFQPGKVYSGYGAVATGGGIDFNATTVWSNWLGCKTCYMPDASGAIQTSGCPKCKDGVNTIRAALGQLGFGTLPMNEPWGAADQGAYKAWAASVGLPSPNGMPNRDDLFVMEKQLKAGTVTGTQAPTSYTKVGTTYVPSETVGAPGLPGAPPPAKAGMEAKDWMLLIGVGVAIVGGVAIYKVYKKGKKPRAPRAAAVPATV
jgi:hypothetical protein